MAQLQHVHLHHTFSLCHLPRLVDDWAELPVLQVALKFEHRSSKGCNYGPPYEWSVYRCRCLPALLCCKPLVMQASDELQQACSPIH